MDVKKLLEYQEKEDELNKLNSEFFGNESVVKNKKSKVLRDDTIAKLNALEQNAAQLLAQCTELKKNIDSICEEIDDFNGIAGETESSEDADFYLKKLSALQDKLYEFEKALNNNASSIEKIKIDKGLLESTKTKCENAITSTKEIVVALKNEILLKGDPIQKEMKKIAQEIPPELFEKYDALKKSGAIKNKKYVGAIKPKEEYCTMCGVNFSSDEKEKAKTVGNVLQCSHCRRLLIVID